MEHTLSQIRNLAWASIIPVSYSYYRAGAVQKTNPPCQLGTLMKLLVLSVCLPVCLDCHRKTPPKFTQAFSIHIIGICYKYILTPLLNHAQGRHVCSTLGPPIVHLLHAQPERPFGVHATSAHKHDKHKLAQQK